MTKESLLKIKKEKRVKNPTFLRQDTNKKKKLDKIWRKPRGHHSKLRQQMSHKKIVKPGYGLPKEYRGMTVEGKNIVHVTSLGDLSKLDPKKDVCVLSGKIGQKNRIIMLEELVKRKLHVVNIKKPEEYLKDKKELFAARKKKVDKPKKVTKKEEEKPESIEEKLNDEDKKKLEKKEIDRLLTKSFDKK